MRRLFGLFGKPKYQITPTREEALFATRESEKFWQQLQDYAVEPSFARAMDRMFLSEGCREFGMALLGQGKASQAIEEFKRAYLLVPHPADFCCIAMAYSDMEAWDQMSKALQQALTGFVSEERALATAQRLFDWLGLQEAENAAKLLVPWMDMKAALRVCPDLYVEREKTDSKVEPRAVLLDWLRRTLQSTIRPQREDHGLCPHCGHTVRPTVETRQCGQCGAVVGLHGAGSIERGMSVVRALYAPERSAVNPALEELVSESKRGGDFRSRFGRLTEGIQNAAIAYATNIAALVTEDDRPSIERGREGIIQLGLRFVLGGVFGAMKGYFEDTQLGSWGLDAVAIELIGRPVSSDTITQSYWKATEIKQEQGLENYSALTQFGRDVAEALRVDIRHDLFWFMIAMAPAPLLEFDAVQAVRSALFDELPDAAKRQELVRSAGESVDRVIDMHQRFEQLFPQTGSESSE